MIMLQRALLFLVAAILGLALFGSRIEAAPPGSGRIAFISDRGGKHRIYSMNADGSNINVLIDPPGNLGHSERFTFSRDGRKIANPDVKFSPEDPTDKDLRQNVICTYNVLDAMRAVPREAFVADWLKGDAYADRPLPIEAGQTISQPYIVALMVEAAGLGPGDEPGRAENSVYYQSRSILPANLRGKS